MEKVRGWDAFAYAVVAAALTPVILVYSAWSGATDVGVHGAAALTVAACVFVIRSAHRQRVSNAIWGLLLLLWVLLVFHRWLAVRREGAEQLLFVGLGVPAAFALWSALSLPIYIAGLVHAWRRGSVNRAAMALALVWLLIVGLNRFPASAAPDVSPWPFGTAWIGLLYLLVILPVPAMVVYVALRRSYPRTIS